MQGRQPTTLENTERRFLGKSRRLKFGQLRPNQRARLWRIIGAICRHELRIAPRLGRIPLPRRILDEIWRRDRKNDQRDAEKPILRKTASRTAPGLEKNGFFHVRLSFAPRRRDLRPFPVVIPEITSSYGGIRVLKLKQILGGRHHPSLFTT